MENFNSNKNILQSEGVTGSEENQLHSPTDEYSFCTPRHWVSDMTTAQQCGAKEITGVEQNVTKNSYNSEPRYFVSPLPYEEGIHWGTALPEYTIETTFDSSKKSPTADESALIIKEADYIKLLNVCRKVTEKNCDMEAPAVVWMYIFDYFTKHVRFCPDDTYQFCLKITCGCGYTVYKEDKFITNEEDYIKQVSNVALAIFPEQHIVLWELPFMEKKRYQTAEIIRSKDLGTQVVWNDEYGYHTLSSSFSVSDFL